MHLKPIFFFCSANFLAGAFGADINAVFRNELHGKAELTGAKKSAIYYHFEQEGMSIVDLSSSNRFEIFSQNLEGVVKHNADPKSSYKKKLNKLSAMTHEEVVDYYGLSNGATASQDCSATSTQEVPKKVKLEDIPSNFDWRDHGGVSPVKDQGGCGSCWTFSTVGCLEAHHLIKYKSLATYSEQQLVDCADAFDNHGCNGGLPSHAFEYIAYNGGIASEQDYPYQAKNGQCIAQKKKKVLEVSKGSVNITAGDEVELLHALYEHGPVSIAFEVVNDGFRDYSTGVYTSKTCKNAPSDVNHAVLAVGYGTDEEFGLDYWLVKNSWGPDWGDNGFFKIERGVNMCGAAQCNSFPYDVSEAGGPEGGPEVVEEIAQKTIEGGEQSPLAVE